MLSKNPIAYLTGINNVTGINPIPLPIPPPTFLEHEIFKFAFMRGLCQKKKHFLNWQVTYIYTVFLHVLFSSLPCLEVICLLMDTEDITFCNYCSDLCIYIYTVYIYIQSTSVNSNSHGTEKFVRNSECSNIYIYPFTLRS